MFEVDTTEVAQVEGFEVETGDVYEINGFEVTKEEFYANDEIWQHEFCDAECDGNAHS